MNIYKEVNVSISDLAHSSKKENSNVLNTLIKDSKSFLEDLDFRNSAAALGFIEIEKSQFIYQGSYAEKTCNKYFRSIEKSDIDIIFKVSEYTQSFYTIKNNPEGNKKIEDWVEYLKPELKGKVYNNINNSNLNSYVCIKNFKKLKDIIFESLYKRFSKNTI